MLKFFLIPALFFCQQAISQVSESYFRDIELKTDGKTRTCLEYKNSILIAGSLFEKGKHMPGIIRVDALGNTLWCSPTNDYSAYTVANVFIDKMMVGSDDYIYATCSAFGQPSDPLTIWKIDPNTGSVVWKRPFSLAYNNELPWHIMDYDTVKFIVSYASGSMKVPHLAFVNKLTGSIMSTIPAGPDYPPNGSIFGLAIDAQKDIYYTCYDSLVKVSGTTLNIMWKTEPTTNVYSYQHIHIDPVTNDIFLMGYKSSFESGIVVKVNPTNGYYVSKYHALTGTVAFRDVKADANGYLYITWRQLYTGGGYDYYYLTKYNKSTGLAAWDISYDFIGVGLPHSGHSGGHQSAMSLDVDKSGDVYLTGYYGDANYGPENWGILKIKGLDGSKLYERTITNDSTAFNDLSEGVAACVINDKPYLIGNLEMPPIFSSGVTRITFVKMDPLGGNTLIRKYVDQFYQFPSAALQIMKYNANKTLVMKQLGRHVSIEMYDFNKNVVWTKKYSKNYHLSGYNMAVHFNGDIFFTAISRKPEPLIPYYNLNADSLFVFHLDSAGKILKEYSISVQASNCYPVELVLDSSSVFCFYQRYNLLHYQKINLASSTALGPYFIALDYPANPTRTKHCVNYNDSLLLVFGTSNAISYLKKINKNNLVVSNMDTLPSSKFYRIYNTLQLDSNNVVLCGRNSSLYETIGLYNITLKDTIWSKTFTTAAGSSVFLKCAFDTPKNYIYTISRSNGDIVARKISILTGQQIWSYTYAGTGSQDDVPLDITWDDFRKQIIISGYETQSIHQVVNKEVKILVLDSLGSLVNSYLKIGEFVGDNFGQCAGVLSDGTQWVGGNLNRNASLDGFIYEIAPSILVSVPDPFIANEAISIDFLVTPVPGPGIFNIETKNVPMIKVDVFNIMGEMVYNQYLTPSFSAAVDISNNAPGVYFLHIKTEVGTFSQKIILQK